MLLTAVAFLGSDTLVSLSHFLLMLSILGNVFVLRRHIDSGSTFERALRTGLGVDFESGIPLSRRMPLSHQINSNAWFHPTRFQRPGVRVERDIAYGPAGKRNLLDIYLPARGWAAPAGITARAWWRMGDGPQGRTSSAATASYGCPRLGLCLHQLSVIAPSNLSRSHCGCEAFNCLDSATYQRLRR